MLDISYVILWHHGVVLHYLLTAYRPKTGLKTVENLPRINAVSIILTSISETIGTITLNNPQKRNALSTDLIDQLMNALKMMSSADVRVVVLRAAKGEKVWSSGHDVHELPMSRRDPLTYTDPLRQVIRTIHEHPHPIIAMVEGSVWGGACELIISCDLVVASKEASFTITPAKLGVPYNLSGVLNLVRATNLLVIKEALFTAQTIKVERAAAIGMVNHVVAVDELEHFTHQLATRIAENSPLVVSVLKEQIRVITEAAPLNPEGFERVQALRRAVYDSEDYKEGIQAFFEKRKPKFLGK